VPFRTPVYWVVIRRKPWSNGNCASANAMMLAEYVCFSSETCNKRVRDALNVLLSDPHELAESLIAARDTNDSLKMLVETIRYRRDANYHESYQCYVFNKGKKIEPFLQNVDHKKLHEQCIQEVKDVSKVLGIDDADVYRVCRQADNIKYDVLDLLAAVKKGVTCEGND